jgi:hypothetical protein
MADILTAVTDAEAKVVGTVRDLQKPVVEYVRKGVKFADSKLPDFPYPTSLPAPTKLVDTQAEFFKSLIDAQADLAKAVIKAVSPLASNPSKVAPATKAATKASAAKARTTKA